LHISDIDLEANTVGTCSQKTGKENPSRPLPARVVNELIRYIDALPEGEDRLFPHQYQHKDWKRIRVEAGVPKLKFHDLRVTFASMLAQKGISQSVVQELLEHSDPRLTHRIYTDVSPVFRAAVETIPLDGITGL
jgi:integrase